MYEEYSTIPAHSELCLNTRPLTPIPDAKDGIEFLTPGHFLIRDTLQALPDPSHSHHPISVTMLAFLSDLSALLLALVI